MNDDLYPRPSRDQIAARVTGSLPGAQQATPPDYVARFAQHMTARMRALGLDAAAIIERTGLSQPTVSRALNGTGVALEIASRLAADVGSALPAMLEPYVCGTCNGSPHAGFACLECGAESRQPTPRQRLAAATAERTGRQP